MERDCIILGGVYYPLDLHPDLRSHSAREEESFLEDLTKVYVYDAYNLHNVHPEVRGCFQEMEELNRRNLKAGDKIWDLVDQGGVAYYEKCPVLGTYLDAGELYVHYKRGGRDKKFPASTYAVFSLVNPRKLAALEGW